MCVTIHKKHFMQRHMLFSEASLYSFSAEVDFMHKSTANMRDFGAYFSKCVHFVCVHLCRSVKVVVLSSLDMPKGLSVLLTHSKVIWLGKMRYSTLLLANVFYLPFSYLLIQFCFTFAFQSLWDKVCEQ